MAETDTNGSSISVPMMLNDAKASINTLTGFINSLFLKSIHINVGFDIKETINNTTQYIAIGFSCSQSTATFGTIQWYVVSLEYIFKFSFFLCLNYECKFSLSNCRFIKCKKLTISIVYIIIFIYLINTINNPIRYNMHVKYKSYLDLDFLPLF